MLKLPATLAMIAALAIFSVGAAADQPFEVPASFGPPATMNSSPPPSTPLARANVRAQVAHAKAQADDVANAAARVTDMSNAAIGNVDCSGAGACRNSRITTNVVISR